MNLLGVADMAWQIKCREEDMAFRKKEIQWHAQQVWWRVVDDRRRAVDEKAKQLEQMALLGAFIAGSAMVAIMQIQIPSETNGFLLICYGVTASAVAGFSIISMIEATFMLVAVMKYDCKTMDPNYPSFQKFWISRCEGDWRFTFRMFNASILCFIAVLAQAGWIIFNGRKNYQISASGTTVVAVCTGVVYWFYTLRKWGDYLTDTTLDLHTVALPDNAADELRSHHHGPLPLPHPAATSLATNGMGLHAGLDDPG